LIRISYRKLPQIGRSLPQVQAHDVLLYVVRGAVRFELRQRHGESSQQAKWPYRRRYRRERVQVQYLFDGNRILVGHYRNHGRRRSGSERQEIDWVGFRQHRRDHQPGIEGQAV
jgi:hypothetical protein